MSGFTDEHKTPTAITAAQPPIVTSVAHGLTNGQRVRATNFVRIPLASATGMYELDDRLFLVWRATTDTFALYDLYGQPIDATTYTPYVSGGQFTLTGPALAVQDAL